MQLDAAGELNPRSRLDERLVADEQVADRARGVVGRFLREQIAAGFDKPTIRDGLRRHTRRRENERRGHDSDERAQHYRRLIACSVKSSAFSGTLYCSPSSVSRVRLPRRRSAISVCRAVQIPWTFSMSL